MDYHLFKRFFKGQRGTGVLTHSHISSVVSLKQDSLDASQSLKSSSVPALGVQVEEKIC